MKALIIGAAGFVGDYLMDYLKARGFDTYVTKLNTERKIGKLGITEFDLNILNPIAVRNLLNTVRPDYIFHLAAQSSVSFSWKNPGLTVDVNVKGSLNVLDGVRQMDYHPRVLLIGSGEEYGYIKESDIPLKETASLHPGNIYAATKVCQNMMGTIYSHAYQMELVMVRAFNHVGPKQSPIFVVSDFCKQVVEIEKGLKPAVIYVGNLEARRDFTDVRDVVRAYECLVMRGRAGETYNVGSGRAVPISEILNKILVHSKAKIEVETQKDKPRPSDIPIIEADISKIRSEVGWKPEITLDKTIQDTLRYWRDSI